MFSSSSIDVAKYTSASETDSEKESVQEKGALEERVVQKTPDLTSKWWGVAIAVGLLVVVGSGFGIVGLLQTYGVLPPLPPSFQWLVSAIDTVGQALPSNGGLWMIAVIGGTIGVSITGIASAKVHQRRMEDKQVEEEKETAKAEFLRTSFSKVTSSFPYLEATFAHNPPESYQLLSDDRENFYIVLNKEEEVVSAGPLNAEKAATYVTQLKKYGFKDLLEIANFSEYYLLSRSQVYKHLSAHTYVCEEEHHHFRIIRRTSEGKLEKSEKIPKEQLTAWTHRLGYDHYLKVTTDDLIATEALLEIVQGLGFTSVFPKELDKKSFEKLDKGHTQKSDYATDTRVLKNAIIYRLPNGELICKPNIEPAEYVQEIKQFLNSANLNIVF